MFTPPTVFGTVPLGQYYSRRVGKAVADDIRQLIVIGCSVNQGAPSAGLMIAL